MNEKEFKNRGLSIITNFGCAMSCKYCIWRDHRFVKRYTNVMTTDWSKLNKILELFPQDKISVSGGGDPLFNFEKHKNWWRSFFAICKQNNKKIDVHTAELIEDEWFLEYINRYVLHLNWNRFIGGNREIMPQLLALPTKIRLTFVIVPPEYTAISHLHHEAILDILEQSKKIKECQVSFRELYGSERDNCDEFQYKRHLREIDKLIRVINNDNIRLVRQDDYNVYYMQDNNLYTDFMSYDKIC